MPGDRIAPLAAAFVDCGRRSGFSLITIAVILTVAAIVMVSFLPGQNVGDYTSKVMGTYDKLDKVEDAMRGFMVAYGRRPCPADGQYALGTQYYGVEAANAGSCTGGTPAAPLGPSGTVVAGVIPTKTLGLPDEYGFDEWGRHFTYVVDTTGTKNSTCVTATTGGTAGGINVKDASGNVTNQVMALYISHGPDGHGAWPEQGSTLANRINSGSTDADTLDNASVNAAFATSFDNNFVKKEKTATFDDFVYLATGGNCCLSGSSLCSATTQVGFRFNGVTAGSTGWAVGSDIAHGDINCDGIQDLVIGDSDANEVYVIFGTSSGFANPMAANTNANNLDGTHGIRLYATGAIQFPKSIAVGDIDNDGCDDLVIGANYDIYILYGRSALKGGAASIDVEALASNNDTCAIAALCSCSAADFWGPGYAPSAAMAIGDVDGDGYNDLIMGHNQDNGGKGIVYVMFGKPNTCTGAGHTVGAGTPTYMYGIDPDSFSHSGYKDANGVSHAGPPTGLMIKGNYAGNSFPSALAVGDVSSHNNGMHDIIIGDRNKDASHNGRVVVVFGQSKGVGGPWNTADIITASALTTSGANTTTTSSGVTTVTAPAGFIVNGSTAAGDSAWIGSDVAAGDITGDGITDIVVGDASSASSSPDYGLSDAYIIKGMSNANWQGYGNGPFTMATMVSNGKALNISDSKELGTGVALSDVNGDGKLDLLVGDQNFTANGSVFVLFGPITTNVDLDAQQPTGDSGALPGVRVDCPASAAAFCGEDLDTVDLNNDGVKDMAICSRYGNVSGSNHEGWCYALFGKTSGWTSTYSLSTIY